MPLDAVHAVLDERASGVREEHVVVQKVDGVLVEEKLQRAERHDQAEHGDVETSVRELLLHKEQDLGGVLCVKSAGGRPPSCVSFCRVPTPSAPHTSVGLSVTSPGDLPSS